MFYRPSDGHGLPHSPFKAIISPRPIGWISTRDSEGRDNLAPYSFFNAFSETPPIVAFGTGSTKIDLDERKDSLANIRQTGEFCVNIVATALQDAMNVTSAHFAQGVDEFEQAGLAKTDCSLIQASRVTQAPAALECRLFQIIDLPGDSSMVIGEVVGIHLDDRHIKDGIFDVTGFQPLARMGYQDYTSVREIHKIRRPE